MNAALRELVADQELDLERHRATRWRFCMTCIERVSGYFEDAEVIACWQAFRALEQQGFAQESIDSLIGDAKALANRHRGSNSIDGVGHAAVSATYCLSYGLAGNILQCADYAAYACVYGQGGYGAVSDLASFEPEYRWQCDMLSHLLSQAT